nr:MAG TPA: hypothetical protein [Bacteriophage sp.]
MGLGWISPPEFFIIYKITSKERGFYLAQKGRRLI